MEISKTESNFALNNNTENETQCKILSLMMQNQSNTNFTNEELQDLQS